MMYIMSFVRRSTHITVNFLSDLHDILCSTIMSIQIFFLDFFSRKMSVNENSKARKH